MKVNQSTLNRSQRGGILPEVFLKRSRDFVRAPVPVGEKTDDHALFSMRMIQIQQKVEQMQSFFVFVTNTNKRKYESDRRVQEELKCELVLFHSKSIYSFVAE
jgi:hypothetical protein